MTVLQNGQAFPALSVPALGGGALSLPDALRGSYGVVLVYRGAWCPYCNGQLAGFARAENALTQLGIRVAALSVDDEATSTALAEKRHWTFPLGYGADSDEGRGHRRGFRPRRPALSRVHRIRPRPDGSVITAVYSSGAIGRLVAEDVIGLVRYISSAS